MKLLITGSSGNVAYFLIKHLLKKNISIVGLDIFDNPLLKHKNFKFIKADVTDINGLRNIFSEEQPTHVIHLAFLMKPMHDLEKERLIDVTGSENVVKAANETKSVKQFIEFSSTSAYGGWPNNKIWLKETDSLRPKDYRYGIDKKKVEEFINNFTGRSDLKFVTVRMCTAIGPSEYKKGGLVRLIAKSPFLIKYDGKYCDLQLLHEDDLSNLICLILNDSEIEGTYNLVPDDYKSIKELAPNRIFLNVPLKIVRGITDILWTLHLSVFTPGAIDLSAYGIVASSEKLQKRYNYKFRYNTLTAFQDSVNGMKKRGVL